MNTVTTLNEHYNDVEPHVSGHMRWLCDKLELNRPSCLSLFYSLCCLSWAKVTVGCIVWELALSESDHFDSAINRVKKHCLPKSRVTLGMLMNAYECLGMFRNVLISACGRYPLSLFMSACRPYALSLFISTCKRNRLSLSLSLFSCYVKCKRASAVNFPASAV